MELKVLGSGSTGNCYLLENDNECLVIECGLPFLEVKKAISFNVMKIRAVIATHDHSDHAKYAKEYEKAGIPVFKPYESESPIGLLGNSQFTVKAFPLNDLDNNWTHTNVDGTECPCYGYYITHPDMGSLVYITDTKLVKWRFNNVNHYLIEANYDRDLIDMESAKFTHVMRGHLAIQTTLDFIRINRHPNLKNVCMCHLSAENGNADNFAERMREIYPGNVSIARKGLKLNLDLIPF